MRYRCVLIFGPPGAGKGTQGKLLAKREGLVHLATGDMFRSIDKESDLGREYSRYYIRGELVPDELTVEIWRDHVRHMIDSGTYDPEQDVLLLDGIPRSLIQAETLDDDIEPLVILHMTAPDLDQMVKRVLSRAEKEGRRDDMDAGIVRNRFDVYERMTAPVLHHYDQGLVVDIDALGTVDEVSERINEVVGEALAR